MTIRQLQKVVTVEDHQYVIINDMKNVRTIQSDGGWVLEPGYDYEGYNYEEIDRILSLSIDEVRFSKNFLRIWAH